MAIIFATSHFLVPPVIGLLSSRRPRDEVMISYSPLNAQPIEDNLGRRDVLPIDDHDEQTQP
jgi:hypothetical protein